MKHSEHSAGHTAAGSFLSVKTNSARAWWLAARPKTLSAALIPVCTASALAFAHGKFSAVPALLCVAFAIFMQVAANFINDLFDFRKGTDGADRLGPERACAQGWISPRAMQIGIAVMLLLAGLVGVSIVVSVFTQVATHHPATDVAVGFLVMGAACVLFAFLYTTLLSYCGLGDVLVWLFFGFVPVCGTYFVQAGSFSPEVWWLAAACGLITDTLLVLNNYRDRDNDRRAGKRTLVVVLGEPFGRYFYLLQGILGYLAAAMLALYGHMWMAVLPLFYVLPHYLTWRKMVQIGCGRELNRVLGFTSRNMLTFAALCILALLAEQMPWDI